MLQHRAWAGVYLLQPRKVQHSSCEYVQGCFLINSLHWHGLSAEIHGKRSQLMVTTSAHREMPHGTFGSLHCRGKNYSTDFPVLFRTMKTDKAELKEILGAQFYVNLWYCQDAFPNRDQLFLCPVPKWVSLYFSKTSGKPSKHIHTNNKNSIHTLYYTKKTYGCIQFNK